MKILGWGIILAGGAVLIWKTAYIFIVHVITDALKARYKAMSYTRDQVIHYVSALVFLI